MPIKFFEHYKRSLTKAFTFRLIILAVDFIIIARLIGRTDVAVGIVAISSVIHTFLYFLHERIWNNVGWGRHHHNEGKK